MAVSRFDGASQEEKTFLYTRKTKRSTSEDPQDGPEKATGATKRPKAVPKTEIPDEIPEEAVPFYQKTYAEFVDLGIDTHRYKRMLIMMAKHLYAEAILEEQMLKLRTQGGTPTAYTSLIKALGGVRKHILDALKHCGLTPVGSKGVDGERSSESPFAHIR